MSAPLPELEVRTRRAWRTWLERHHGSSAGVWLVFHKQHTGVASVPYDDAVREALCFGWIDSLVRRLDDDRYARKFTPRKPGSAWSASNLERWAELDAAGALAPAGRAASPKGAPRATPPPPTDVPELPGYIADALRRNRKAWAFFQGLPPGERRRFVGWIHVAKKAETKERRIREAVRLLAKGERLGLR
ncbi:MAG: YdeI family protein [Gemmatimonadales bacterium]